MVVPNTGVDTELPGTPPEPVEPGKKRPSWWRRAAAAAARRLAEEMRRRNEGQRR